ncbi:MAG: glycosyltransferase family 4 protein, partial [Nitrospinota bacterium]
GARVAERAKAMGIGEVGSLALPGSFRPHHYLEDILTLKRLSKALSLDVVHVHRGVEHWLAAAALTGKRRPALVRSRHILLPVERSPFNRWLYNRATDRVVAAAEVIRQGYLGDGFFREEKFVTLAGGVDTEAFRPELDGQALRRRETLPLGVPLIGVVGTLAYMKGQEYLIRSMAILKERGSNALLLIIGQGGDEGKLRELVRELGLEGYVLFMGFRPELPPLMAALDIGVFPSISSEGTSRVLFEHMAAGKPLVATDVGCVREIVRHEREGLIVPPRSAEALAASILRLLEEPALRERMGREARCRAEEEFSRSALAFRMEGVYREAMEERLGGGRLQ